ncbi:histone deacetylase family protein [Fodinicurvata halophila]|uniref:Histone deacetylase family protein n=1 Tax=Fodinicurvata halophila TaxID=1419723 RepID=A0ABV8UR48_9PROT
MPRRADLILDQVRRRALGPVEAPREWPLEALTRAHDSDYVDFLKSAWTEWSADGRSHDALPLAWSIRGLRDVIPQSIMGRLSYYSFDAGTPITAGTWPAVYGSACVALSGQERLIGEGHQAVFALCRPPGHHAAADYYGGYCFLNNAAIAAQALRDGGAERVAVFDVDYHHGNGTQAIFYDRSDVFFASVHGDPRENFPFFLGYADEIGTGQGEGFNANYPLPWGSGFDAWREAFERALARLDAFAPDAVVISLGVDTFKDDPISGFRLESDDYFHIGRALAGLNRPTLFVMEGGYAVEEIGINTVNLLTGFEEAA